jgi:methyl-accepting chemotaxis protein
MIDGAIRSVQEGNALSEELEKQLTCILSQIGGFKEAMHAMKAGSEQQCSAITQVASSMGEIEKITQRNAAAAEESAAASHEMEAQSQAVLQQIQYLEAILIGMRARQAATPNSADNQPA